METERIGMVLYLDDFEGRLSMADVDKNLIVVELESETGDFSTVRIALERYGSRAYPFWYSRMKEGAQAGLGQAKTGIWDNCIWMYEKFDDTDTLSCAVAATILEPGATMKNTNGRRCEFTTGEYCYHTQALSGNTSGTWRNCNAHLI